MSKSHKIKIDRKLALLEMLYLAEEAVLIENVPYRESAISYQLCYVIL
jgi:hypothetical protein